MNATALNPEFLSQSELLRHLNLPTSKVKKLTALGFPPDIKIGRLNLYRKDRLSAIRTTLAAVRDTMPPQPINL